MRARTGFSGRAVLAAAGLAIAGLWAPAAWAQSAYQYQPLKNTRSGYAYVQGLAISSGGQIAGTLQQFKGYAIGFGQPGRPLVPYVYAKYETRAAVWSSVGSTTPTLIPSTPTSAKASYVASMALNNKGALIVNWGGGASAEWVNGVAASFSSSPAFALGVNDQGWVVGHPVGLRQATLWQSGLTTVLDTSPDGSEAVATNNAGQVAVLSFVPYDPAYSVQPSACGIWSHGSLVRLPSTAGTQCTLTALNDNGTAVGTMTRVTADNTLETTGVAWVGGQLQVLPTVNSTVDGLPLAMLPVGVSKMAPW